MASDDYKIKEVRFAPLVHGSNPVADSTYTQTSDQFVNGEILEVQWKASTAGSLVLTQSGTGIEVFRRNAPSGAAWQTTAPRQFGQLTTGSVTAATMVAFNLNEPVVLQLITASGTAVSGLSFQANVRYR